MNIKLLTNSDAEKALIDLTNKCKSFQWAVAWATPNQVTQIANKHRSKLKKLIIGTHFYQTSPEVLKLFSDHNYARIYNPNGKLFHPKIYLFNNGNTYSALVGSHNLTQAAFNQNTEASILFTGNPTEESFRQLERFISSAWDDAEAISEEFIYSYQVQYKAKRPAANTLSTYRKLKRPTSNSKKGSPFDISWDSFIHHVKGDRHHSLEGRLKILDESRRLFDLHGKFSRMDKMDRKAIAGTMGKNEEVASGLPWGWFGTMSGHGGFSQVVNESPEWLSRALDQIPSNEPVTEENYNAFVKLFIKAFEKSKRKGNIPSASRLLAMKRPDQFVATNHANKKGLCEAFGVAPSTLSLDNYWDRIVVPIRNSPFWLHERPQSKIEGCIWDNRAALLDSIYYEPLV